MTDDDNVLRSSREFRLTADALTLMLKGAGYAALFCGAILLVGMILLAISRALPEQSKQSADPTPDLSMAEPLAVPALA